MDGFGPGQRQPDIQNWQVGCVMRRAAEQGGVVELVVLDSQRSSQSRQGGCGACQIIAGRYCAEPLLYVAAQQLLRVTRSLAARALSRANSGSGS
jgi:hypothetical protein